MKIQLSDHFTYKKLARFVLPSIVMMAFSSIYGMVDGLFVSWYAGKTAFASLNLVMPFIMIIGGMGFMVGTGGTALVSKIMGEGDRKRANEVFSMMILFGTALGIVLSVLGFTFMPQVVTFLNATPEMFDDAVLYGRVNLAFVVFFMLQNIFQSFCVAAEKPKLGLLATVFAGISNMIGDAIFVAVLDKGVAGAALATGLSQIVGAGVPMAYFLFNKDGILKLRFKALEWKPILSACFNGFSEFVGNISSSIVGMLYNFQLLKYIGENGVSAYGVIMYVQFLFIALYFGYAIGVGPLVSYNYGSQNINELQNLFRKSIKIMLCAGVLLVATAELAAPLLAKIFVGYDAELHALTTYAFRIYSMSLLFAGMNIYTSALFTALNNGKISAISAVMRSLVFQASAVLTIPLIIGVEGIWFSNIFAECGCLLVNLCFLFHFRKQYHYC